jgi:hypothetical protein
MNNPKLSTYKFECVCGHYAIIREAVAALDPPASASAGVCRVCSCTDLEACAEGCFWVEPDLCSGCLMILDAIAAWAEQAHTVDIAVLIREVEVYRTAGIAAVCAHCGARMTADQAAGHICLDVTSLEVNGNVE